MKTKSYFLIGFFIFASIILFAQTGMTIQSGGSVTVNGNTMITACTPEAPTAGQHVASSVQIIWKWNPVPGATGYKWNTINNYNTAIDVGATTTKVETGLNYNTTYTRYIWAYVVFGSDNSISTTFTTLPGPSGCGTITDLRDGKTYNTILIGTQCWMAQNLNIGTRISGSSNQTNNGVIEKYCYDNDENNCNIYGGLYKWNEAMQYSITPGVQGICPEGWHFPTDAEWCQLETFLDATVNCSITGSRGTDVAGKMKETGTSHWSIPNAGATNESGFTALPGGYCGQDFDGFYSLSFSSYWWTSTETSSSSVWEHLVGHNDATIYRYNSNKSYGFSVRCLKD